ncbi:unnamed protein product [Caenorhabditis auriculariae]|uniref:Innexin n=1 Tax=Caenorhabditis auriculariae TaxID=2777116 RepID=A0A8S1HKB2_9PELO|nr:unnamed protein product [Caenorhabditis auriculariae]
MLVIFNCFARLVARRSRLKDDSSTDADVTNVATDILPIEETQTKEEMGGARRQRQAAGETRRNADLSLGRLHSYSCVRSRRRCCRSSPESESLFRDKMMFIDFFLKGLKPHYDDDSVDRLNYYFTPMLLVIFALTLSAKQYVGQPIQCWIPAQFTGAWEQYSENYCFVQNTYFIRPDRYIPDSTQEREDNEIGYYQWVPFILGIQAILFGIPALFWRLTNWQSGIAVKSIIRMARDTSNMNVDRRHESVGIVAAHVHDSLRIQSQLYQTSSWCSFMYRGNYLTMLYLFVKFLYFLQVLLQFVILNNFLTTSYTFWGFGILNDLIHGREWEESGHFPRVTLCDFEVRVLGNKHRHTVQCVLMINMFNEKVYLFLWFWLLMVALATLVNLLQWTVRLTSPSIRRKFVSTYLRVHQLVTPDDVSSLRAFERFVEKDLRSDGVLIVNLISKNAGDILTTDLVTSLWGKFLEDEEKSSRRADSPHGGFKEDLSKRLA